MHCWDGYFSTMGRVVKDVLIQLVEDRAVLRRWCATGQGIPVVSLFGHYKTLSRAIREIRGLREALDVERRRVSALIEAAAPSLQPDIAPILRRMDGGLEDRRPRKAASSAPPAVSRPGSDS